MTAIQVRPPRPGDGAGYARAWTDAGRHYAELNPDAFQVPAGAGLAGWFEQHIIAETDPDTLRLVADVGGEVAGFLTAVFAPPDPGADRELLRDLSRPRVFVQIVAVAEAHRRGGAGTALMSAAEAWARDRGATMISLHTYVHSSMAVPFYEDRLGYTRRAIVFRKDLA